MISNFKLWMVNGCKRISYSGCNIISFLIDSDNMDIHFDNSGDAKKCPELNSYSMVLNFSQGYQLSKFTRNRVALTTGYDVVDFEDVTPV